MYGRSFVAQLSRIGREITILEQSQTGTNDFGNPTEEWTATRTCIAARSYPNRNTEVEADIGDRHRNNPIFFSPNTDDQPDPPQEGDIIEYRGTKYEVQGHTEYDTHVEYFGKIVRHE